MVSIIIPVYNAERTIRRCFDSIRRQKLESVEYIFVNDGSKDNSQKLLLEFAKECNNIKIIDKENGGVSSARNIGIKHAEGEFVCFIDADDYYLDDNYISQMLHHIVNDNCDIAISGYSIIKDIGIQIIDTEPCVYTIVDFLNEFVEFSKKGIINSPCNKLFKKELIIDLFNEDMTFGEDAIFVANYLTRCKQVVLCSSVGYGYEVLNLSTTSNFRKTVKYDAKQTMEYYHALSNLWFSKLKRDDAIEIYTSMRTDGIMIVLLRLFKRDGPIGYIFEDIKEIIDDKVLYMYKDYIFKKINDDIKWKIAKMIISKQQLKLKLYVIYKHLFK